MPRSSDGRTIRAVRAAHGLIRVAALGVGAATIEKRAETCPRVARDVAKAQAAVAAKSWSAGLIELGGLEIAELKRQPGKDILLTGGARLAASLTELGLLDDCRIVIHPVVLGGGPPLFMEPKDRIGMRLVDSRTFDSQTVLLRYERRP